MKLNLSILTGVTSLAALISGVFADTAVTDPVGYISIDLPTNANGTAGTLKLIAPSLVGKTAVQSAASADASGQSTITFAAAVPVEVVANLYFVEIVQKDTALADHPNEGFWATITNVSGNTITLNRPVPTGSSTAVFAIRPHQTIRSFGGLTNSLNLDPGTETADSDTLQLLNPSTGLTSSYFFGDSTVQDVEAVWYDENGNRLGVDIPDVVINPGQGVLLTRRENTPGEKGIVVGHVKTNKTRIYVSPGLNVIDLNRAVGSTMVDSGLDNGDLTGATGLLPGEETATADTMSFIPALNGTDTGYFAAPPISMLGIVNQDGTERGNLQVNEGLGILLDRKTVAGPGFYTVNRAVINVTP